jgi:hypothetical protein
MFGPAAMRLPAISIWVDDFTRMAVALLKRYITAIADLEIATRLYSH